jgi:hypothetical protein
VARVGRAHVVRKKPSKVNGVRVARL